MKGTRQQHQSPTTEAFSGQTPDWREKNACQGSAAEDRSDLNVGHAETPSRGTQAHRQERRRAGVDE